MIRLSTYLKQYRVGDIVDVVCNGAVQKGMVRKLPSDSQQIISLFWRMYTDDGRSPD